MLSIEVNQQVSEASYGLAVYTVKDSDSTSQGGASIRPSHVVYDQTGGKVIYVALNADDAWGFVVMMRNHFEKHLGDKVGKMHAPVEKSLRTGEPRKYDAKVAQEIAGFVTFTESILYSGLGLSSFPPVQLFSLNVDGKPIVTCTDEKELASLLARVANEQTMSSTPLRPVF